MRLFTKTHQPILAPREEVRWASGAVFNPGAWYEDGVVHLLFRAIPSGYKRVPLPSAGPYEPSAGFDENYISAIGYAHSTDGVHFVWDKNPLIRPDADFDRYGAEDPRVSKIDDEFLITYTALSKPAFGSEDGVRVGLASTTDFRDIVKHGVVGPGMRDKDAVIFPRRIGGRVVMLHRIVPDIQIVFFDDVEQLSSPPHGFWEAHLDKLHEWVVMRGHAAWESKKIGAGPTPVETSEGWLVIYHGVDEDHVYRAGLALLDLDNPQRVIARSADPVIEPEFDFELFGDVNNVVFPEGAVVIGTMLHLYYGAADRVVGHARARVSDLLDYLLGQ